MSTGWSELPPTFLSEGEWSVGQGDDAPDRQLVRKLVAAWECPSILEVGFGPGIDVPALAELGDYTGIDATKELVDRARTLWPRQSFDCADICNWQATSPYTVVYARHVLEHVQDGEAALRALWAATDGILILSWFIRPTWAQHEEGCVEGDGFEHHTYSAPRWISLANQLGAHLYRFDFDHHSTKASVWIMARESVPQLAEISARFLQSPECLAATIPVPEPNDDIVYNALKVMGQAYEAMGDAIPIVERVDDLLYVIEDNLAALTRAERFMEPTQDESSTADEIRRVRDSKGRAQAALEGGVDCGGRVQALRDAKRVVESRLDEAGRLPE